MQTTFQRRLITDTQEKKQAHAELEQKVAEVADEHAQQKEIRDEALKLSDSLNDSSKDSQSNWKPPRTFTEFFELVERDHPDWPFMAKHYQAKMLFERHPLIEKAFMDGLNMGRTLRERAKAGLGWWWDSLEPLKPIERGTVLAKVQQIVMGDVEKKLKRF